MYDRKESDTHRDCFRGCLLGGAAGDALGYAVEFMGEGEIFKRYGSEGIRAYEVSGWTDEALISDDTQMTLFTANALLVGDTAAKVSDIRKPYRYWAQKAYLDWLRTQSISYAASRDPKVYPGSGICWICELPELYSLRAPGNTCLSSLRYQKHHPEPIEDYIETKVNNSKGCGGVMRVAPMGLVDADDIRQLDLEGAQVAAVTHGKPLGYMPAAVITHVINRIAFPKEADNPMSLKEIVLEARDTMQEIFAGEESLPELIRIIDLAIELSENDRDDLDNIHRLGEGWVAEETMGIALYCTLKYQDDFTGGLVAAVNHKGDSDSTGAVAGNMLGAWLGYKAIDRQWKEHLELSDVILELADDLCDGCPPDGDDPQRVMEWKKKYIR